MPSPVLTVRRQGSAPRFPLFACKGAVPVPRKKALKNKEELSGGTSFLLSRFGAKQHKGIPRFPPVSPVCMQRRGGGSEKEGFEK